MAKLHWLKGVEKAGVPSDSDVHVMVSAGDWLLSKVMWTVWSRPHEGTALLAQVFDELPIDLSGARLVEFVPVQQHDRAWELFGQPLLVFRR